MTNASAPSVEAKAAPRTPTWGQVVVGPPGSGKSTYCAGMQQYLELSGRQVAVINLDPAADPPPQPGTSATAAAAASAARYTPAVDIQDLVSLEAVQRELGLGPNGGLVYCLDYLAQNLDWLEAALAPLEAEGKYLLFDLPGQVELFTMHGSLRRILDTLTTRWQYRLTAVQLVDAHLCSDPAKYLAALLLSLGTMLHLELPQVNVLSKMDLVEQYGPLSFSLEFYLQAQGLSHLADAMEGSGSSLAFPPRFQRMTRELCEVVEDFGLLSFQPLAIEDVASVRHLAALVDKSNGYVFAGLAEQGQAAPELRYSAGAVEDGEDLWQLMQERYVRRGTTDAAAADYDDANSGGGDGPALVVRERLPGEADAMEAAEAVEAARVAGQQRMAEEAEGAAVGDGAASSTHIPAAAAPAAPG